MHFYQYQSKLQFIILVLYILFASLHSLYFQIYSKISSFKVLCTSNTTSTNCVDHVTSHGSPCIPSLRLTQLSQFHDKMQSDVKRCIASTIGSFCFFPPSYRRRLHYRFAVLVHGEGTRLVYDSVSLGPFFFPLQSGRGFSICFQTAWVVPRIAGPATVVTVRTKVAALSLKNVSLSLVKHQQVAFYLSRLFSTGLWFILIHLNFQSGGLALPFVDPQTTFQLVQVNGVRCTLQSPYHAAAYYSSIDRS